MGLDDNRFTNKDAEDTPACASGGKGARMATGQGEQRSHATGGGNLPFVGCLRVTLTPGQFFRLRAGPRSGESRWASPIIQHTTGSTQVCRAAERIGGAQGKYKEWGPAKRIV